MDLFHSLGFVTTLGSFLTLRLTGHSDTTTDQALFSLASLIAGSFLRATLGIQK
jgi:hypothetical protein